jgi:hypothetical protein
LNGIRHLSQLTTLELDSFNELEISTASTSSWGPLTALEKLSMGFCVVQPDAVAALMQLRSLSLVYNTLWQDTGTMELFAAVSQLLQLTELVLTTYDSELGQPRPAATAFTALTSSTNLCSLQLGLCAIATPTNWALFRPGTVYPQLREINLIYERSAGAVPLSEQQLQQLCSCCPAVESLRLGASSYQSPTALMPLLQLSALTQLTVFEVGAAAASVVRVVAQLTGLKDLRLSGLNRLADPALRQLTALTALEELGLWDRDYKSKSLHNKVSCVSTSVEQGAWLTVLSLVACWQNSRK